MAVGWEVGPYEIAPSGTPVSFTGSVSNQLATQGQLFTYDVGSQFTVGDFGPLAFSLQAGTLEPALSLNTTTGVITGIPTTSTDMTGLVVRATDQNSNTADSTPAFNITVSATLTPVAFTGSVSNQDAYKDVPFTYDLSGEFSGSQTPFSYAVTNGSLPAGLSLGSSTGVISGTPTTPAEHTSIIVTATDQDSDTASTTAFNITVNAVTGVAGWEVGPYEILGSPPGAITLQGEPGTYSSEGQTAALVISEGVSPVTLLAEPETFTIDGHDARLNFGDLIAQIEIQTYAIVGFEADAKMPGMYTYPLTENSGTVAKCLEGSAFNATVSASGWATTPDNNKRWPINEGTGATLSETETGDNTYDATIQNFTEIGWGEAGGASILRLSGNGARYITTPQFDIPAGNNFRIAFDMVRAAPVNDVSTKILGMSDNSFNLQEFGTGVTNPNFARIRLNDVNYDVSGALTGISMGEQYHCEWVVTGTTAEVFINGVSKGTVTVAAAGFSVDSLYRGDSATTNAIATGGAMFNVLFEDTTTGGQLLYRIDEGSGTTILARDENGAIAPTYNGTANSAGWAAV